MNRNKQLKFLTFLKFLKCFFCINQYMGLMPITWSNKKFLISNILSCLNVLFIIGYSLLILYCQYQTFNSEEKKFVIVVESILQIFGPIYIILTWINALKKRQKLCTFLEDMSEYDQTLAECGMYNHNKTEKYTIRITIRYTILLLLITWSIYIQFDHLKKRLSLYVLMIVHTTISFQAIEFVKLLKNRFAVLNYTLIKIIKQEPHEEIKLINLINVSCMHHRLCKLITLFNDIFGVVLLFFFTLNFVVIVLTFFFYSAYLQSSQVNWIGAILRIAPSIGSILDTVYACNACYTTREELKKSGRLIHKIESDKLDVIDEIEMFSLQIANNNSQFSAAGFFVVDYTLLFSVSLSFISFFFLNNN